MSHIEHANITVLDTDSMIEFIQTAVPDFVIRKRWISGEIEWTHIGTETSYIALMHRRNLSKEDMELYHHNSSAIGFNHIGIEVSDVEGVRRTLLNAGYWEGFNGGRVVSEKFRKSVYFRDPDGREFEFVEYLTESIAKRNSYES